MGRPAARFAATPARAGHHQATGQHSPRSRSRDAPNRRATQAASAPHDFFGVRGGYRVESPRSAECEQHVPTTASPVACTRCGRTHGERGGEAMRLHGPLERRVCQTCKNFESSHGQGSTTPRQPWAGVAGRVLQELPLSHNQQQSGDHPACQSPCTPVTQMVQKGRPEDQTMTSDGTDASAKQTRLNIFSSPLAQAPTSNAELHTLRQRILQLEQETESFQKAHDDQRKELLSYAAAEQHIAELDLGSSMEVGGLFSRLAKAVCASNVSMLDCALLHDFSHNCLLGAGHSGCRRFSRVTNDFAHFAFSQGSSRATLECFRARAADHEASPPNSHLFPSRKSLEKHGAKHWDSSSGWGGIGINDKVLQEAIDRLLILNYVCNHHVAPDIAANTVSRLRSAPGGVRRLMSELPLVIMADGTYVRGELVWKQVNGGFVMQADPRIVGDAQQKVVESLRAEYCNLASPVLRRLVAAARRSGDGFGTGPDTVQPSELVGEKGDGPDQGVDSHSSDAVCYSSCFRDEAFTLLEELRRLLVLNMPKRHDVVAQAKQDVKNLKEKYHRRNDGVDARNKSQQDQVVLLERAFNEASRRLENVAQFVHGTHDSIITQLLGVDQVLFDYIDLLRVLPQQYVVTRLGIITPGAGGHDELANAEFISKSCGAVQDELMDEFLRALRRLPDGDAVLARAIVTLDGEHHALMTKRQNGIPVCVGDIIADAKASDKQVVKGALDTINRKLTSASTVHLVNEARRVAASGAAAIVCTNFDGVGIRRELVDVFKFRPVALAIPDDTLLESRPDLRLSVVQQARMHVASLGRSEQIDKCHPDSQSVGNSDSDDNSDSSPDDPDFQMLEVDAETQLDKAYETVKQDFDTDMNVEEYLLHQDNIQAQRVVHKSLGTWSVCESELDLNDRKTCPLSAFQFPAVLDRDDNSCQVHVSTLLFCSLGAAGHILGLLRSLHFTDTMSSAKAGISVMAPKGSATLINSIVFWAVRARVARAQVLYHSLTLLEAELLLECSRQDASIHLAHSILVRAHTLLDECYHACGCSIPTHEPQGAFAMGSRRPLIVWAIAVRDRAQSFAQTGAIAHTCGLLLFQRGAGTAGIKRLDPALTSLPSCVTWLPVQLTEHARALAAELSSRPSREHTAEFTPFAGAKGSVTCFDYNKFDDFLRGGRAQHLVQHSSRWIRGRDLL